jgi:hypothetical protein
MVKTYSELIKYNTFEERFQYLKLSGAVGVETFGFDRYLNQLFYKSYYWMKLRSEVILRDLSCDLAVEGFEISSRPVIHHMNPMRPVDLVQFDPKTIDIESLITVSFKTHMAIHYGSNRTIAVRPVKRMPGDTCLWR